MKNSLKFLVRTPLKTVLFFLLITAALTVLFTGAKIGSMTSAKIEAVESTFTTLGTVEQTNVNTFPQVTLWSQNENWLKSQDADPDSTPIEKGYFQDFWPTLLDWEELERDYLSPDLLQFEGAGYVQGPEKRPYYGAWIPELQVKQPSSGFFSVLEFTPVEDTVPGLPFLAKIDRVLFGNSPGEEAYLCDHFNPEPRSLEAGKTYIAFIPGSSVVYAHEGSDELVREFPIYPFPIYGHPNSQCPYYAEVTENFYDTQWGKVWENLVQALERKRSTYPVLPTDSLDLLPTFHKGLVSVKFGREITEEEFQAGDKVCLAPMDFLLEQELEVGDTLPVSLYYADSFFSPRVEYGDRGVVNYSCMNLLDDQYQVPDVFWEEEYEIVGAYLTTGVQNATRDESEITNGLLILPSASVGPVPAENMLDTGPMLSTTTSFIIPNGTATEYLEKFRENVPESENLEITFRRRGLFPDRGKPSGDPAESRHPVRHWGRGHGRDLRPASVLLYRKASPSHRRGTLPGNDQEAVLPVPGGRADGPVRGRLSGGRRHQPGHRDRGGRPFGSGGAGVLQHGVQLVDPGRGGSPRGGGGDGRLSVPAAHRRAFCSVPGADLRPVPLAGVPQPPHRPHLYHQQQGVRGPGAAGR